VLTGLFGVFDDTVPFDHTGRDTLTIKRLFQYGHVVNHATADLVDFQSKCQAGHYFSGHCPSLITFYFLMLDGGIGLDARTWILDRRNGHSIPVELRAE